MAVYPSQTSLQTKRTGQCEFMCQTQIQVQGSGTSSHKTISSQSRFGPHKRSWLRGRELGRCQLPAGLQEDHLLPLGPGSLCLCTSTQSAPSEAIPKNTDRGRSEGRGRVTDTQQHLCPGPCEWKSVSQKLSMWPLLWDSEAAWSLAPGCGLPGPTEYAQVRKLPGCLNLQPPGIPPPQCSLPSLPSSLHASCPPFYRLFFLFHPSLFFS